MLSYSDFLNMCNSKSLNIQYNLTIDGNDKYYELWSYDQNEKYNCVINNVSHSSDVSNFESNYKDEANKKIYPLMTEGVTKWLKTRARTVAGDLKGKFIYFTLGDDESLDCDSDTSYSIYVETGRTYIDFYPSYGYEISGGRVQIHATATEMANKSCKLAFIMAPDIGEEYGGNWKFISNKKLCEHSLLYERTVDPKWMGYVEGIPANKLRVEFTYDTCPEIEVEIYLDIYIA